MPKQFKLRLCSVFTLSFLLITQCVAFGQAPRPQQTPAPRPTPPAQQRAASGAALTVRDIMAEPSLAGMRAEGEKISPDGARAAFLWSAAGREPRDLYTVATTGGEPRLLVRAVDTPQEQRPVRDETRDEARAGERREERVMQRDAAQQAREQSVASVEWSPDSRRLLYSKGGDLYFINADGAGGPRRLTRTVAPETSARWLADGRRILFQSGGNIFVIGVDEPSFTQLTREGGGGGPLMPPSQVVGGAQVSDDGARVAYVVADVSRQRPLFVPNYTGDYVTVPTVRRGWSEQRIHIVETSGATERPVVVRLPAPEGASYIRNIRWTADNAALVIDRVDRDTKRRQLFLAAARDGAARLIDEETDAKWIAPLSRIVEPAPRGDRVLFASERDGFNHLYLLSPESSSGQTSASIPAQASASAPPTPPAAATPTPSPQPTTSQTPPAARPQPQQLTRGAWEVSWAGWLPDGERVIYSSTEVNTAERHFYLLDTRSGRAERLQTQTGMNIDPQLARNGSVLLFEHSQWNVPTDLYALRLDGARATPQRLTNTVPERFRQVDWARPQFIEYRAQDGKTVKARLYLPRGFERARRYPAAVFVHGAGYLQNVINGWNNYYREFMFNHMLTERGYVVLDIDYRGSAGYGRDWRTDVHDFLGGLDLQDHLDGIDYIANNYSVDRARVGMYGGSYGGFMAEMAAMRAPDHVAAAAALRPVADWRNYYAASPVYTTERLGFPDRNPEAYRRSSPISYAAQLRRPLLILHGMLDDNVHFQDSVQLVQKLIDLGKTQYFEVMFYPRENHAFTQPEGWADEYERILWFFERHLRPNAGG